MIILKIKSKGLMLNLPGFPPCRTPVEIDITNQKLPIIVSMLYNNGINDFEILQKKEEFQHKDLSIKKPKKKKNNKDVNNIEFRINKIEKVLDKLVGFISKENLSEEQITNKLEKLEKLSQKILEKERIKEVVYTTKMPTDNKNPIIEDLDEDIYVPDVDISDLKLKGTSSQTVGEVTQATETANILSRLRKKEDNK